MIKKKKKTYKKLLILGIAIYVIFTLVNQQKTLNQYNQDTIELASQIKEAKENKEELTQNKEDVTSRDFIEQTAREKLDMYYPNERVYVDIGM